MYAQEVAPCEKGGPAVAGGGSGTSRREATQMGENMVPEMSHAARRMPWSRSVSVLLSLALVTPLVGAANVQPVSAQEGDAAASTEPAAELTDWTGRISIDYTYADIYPNSDGSVNQRREYSATGVLTGVSVLDSYVDPYVGVDGAEVYLLTAENLALSAKSDIWQTVSCNDKVALRHTHVSEFSHTAAPSAFLYWGSGWSPGYGEPVIAKLVVTPDGAAYFQPYYVGYKGGTETHTDCDGDKHVREGGGSVLSYIGGTSPEPTGPLRDVDVDPLRINAETTYTFADPPMSPESFYPYTTEYRYMLDVDLEGVGAERAPEFEWDVTPGVWDVSPGASHDSTSSSIFLAQDGAVATALSRDGARDTLPFRGPDDSTVDPLLDVNFDGCANPGWESVSFVVDGVLVESRGDPPCKATAELVEGEHEVTITVVGGLAAGVTKTTIDVGHYVILGVGDSYASGEGVEPPASWANENCRRSGGAPQARAALALEEAERHSAVTFVFLACSGATAASGLLGDQGSPPGKQREQAQLSRAATLLEGLVIDRVLMSIGGNDIGFGDVILTCAVFGQCPLQRRRAHNQECELLDPRENRYHSRYKCRRTVSRHNLHEQVQLDLAGLDEVYSEIGAKFLDLGLVGDLSDVLHTEYPTISTELDYPDADTLKSPSGTRYCDGSMRPPFHSGIADEEFAWATEVVQEGNPSSSDTFIFQRNWRRDWHLHIREPGLNTTIRSGMSGFTPLVGIAVVFDGHGYCAPDRDRYIVTLDDFGTFGTKLGENPTGAMHPTLLGQKVWGEHLAADLLHNLKSYGS